MCIIFWDTTINQKHIKYMRRLKKVEACGEYCVLITKLEDTEQDEWLIVLCNAVGCPLEQRTINIEPRYVAMSQTHVIVADNDTVYYWQYRGKGQTIEQQKKAKSGKENAFYIDEIPRNDSNYDKDKFQKSNQQNTDQITCIAASTDSFIVGRMSGTVQKYTLPYIQQESKITLRCRPQQMKLNCDGTKFSIIDINGVASFFDMTDTQDGPQGTHLANDRKEVWSIVWSTDNPNLCALMEKNRLFVLNNFEQEDPILSAGYLCDFTDLEVKAVLLDEILKDPEEIKNIGEMVVSYEQKNLRDARQMLTQVNLKETVEFVEKNPHKRLWRLITEASLDKLNFGVAERAFVKTEDYSGLQLIEKLNNLDEKVKQKAEIACFFKRYDEAEQIFKDIGRKDLALDLRMRLGDWSRVVPLLEQNQGGSGSDAMLTRAYKNLGDFSAERQKWAKACKYYKLANDFESLCTAYYKMEDYASMEGLINFIPQASPLLETLGEKFQSMGLCQAAVNAYVKFGDVKRAIDCCVLLN